MWKAIKTILISCLLLLVGNLFAGIFVAAYYLVVHGAEGLEKVPMSSAAAVLSIWLGFALVALYLWQGKYLSGDSRLYAPTSVRCLGWTCVAGVTAIMLIDAVMSLLTFLPDWTESTFDMLQGSWVGIFGICIFGPIVEELLFRGTVTKLLLSRYKPWVAIVLSGFLFGIYHMNPVQIVAASFSGFFLGWLYYRTRSLVPCIVVHILNNSLSVWGSLQFPDAELTVDIMGTTAYAICVGVSIPLFLLAVWQLQRLSLNDE